MTNGLAAATTIIACAAAVLAAITSVVVTVITRRQWMAMRQGLELQSMLTFWEKFETRSMQDLRDTMRKSTFDVSKVSRDTMVEVRQYLNLMELLSSFVERGLINIETVEEVFHSSIPEVWIRLEPYIQLRRQQEGIRLIPYAANFERLVRLYDLRRKVL
jgi:hypothetical protein